MTLDGRVALITGASEGIGKGIAMGMAEAGAEVILASRRLGHLEQVVDEIQGRGGVAHAVPLDVTDVESIHAARSAVESGPGRLDILVNNAAASVNRPAWEVTVEDWNLIMDTGPKATMFCSQIFGELIRERGYGKIINLSSTLSATVVAGASVYAASKATISHLTRALATEWARDGIRVNAIAPTSIPTPSRLPTMTPEKEKAIRSRIPLDRLGSVDDLIPLAVFLASAASDFITGQTVFIDGGWTASS